MFCSTERCFKCGFKAWDRQELLNHDKDTHGLKKRCPESGCTFISPDSHWRLYRYHYQQAHPSLPVQEPASVVKPQKRKLPPATTPCKKSNHSVMVKIPLELLSLPQKERVSPVEIPLERVDSHVALEPEVDNSDWDEEPETGFLQLLEEEDSTVIAAGMDDHSPMDWKLVPVHVPTVRRVVKTGSLDPRV